MDIIKLKKLLSHQQAILSKIALGAPLNEIFNDICISIEDITEDKSARCSILSLQGEQLFHCAAPNIDDKYCQFINGLYIGPSSGACGTAAFRKSQVIVENIAISPLWVDFKDCALAFDLQSCWSTPILSTQSIVLGTFAIYHNYPKSPSVDELELIDYFVHSSSIALEKHHNLLKFEQLITDLQQSNEKFNAFTKVMPDLAFILSENGEYCDIYGSSEGLLYDTVNKLINKNLKDILPKKNSEPIMAVIEKTLATNEIQIFEYELDVHDGKIIFEGRIAPIDNYQPNMPNKRHVVWVARDITDRKRTEKKVAKLAFFDALTDLPNRRMLNDRLGLCIERIKRTKKVAALFFIDLDHFKKINDLLGHCAGDELLVKLSKRLRLSIRSSDTVARVGGDEFIVLLESVGDNNKQAIIESENVAQKLQNVFYEKFQIGGVAFQVSCSIGICLVNNDNLIKENILKHADSAMYRSKIKGGNRYSFYHPELQTSLEKQVEIETDMLRAIALDEFCTYFQPQVNTLGNVVGAEALIRWNHPIKGLIAPADFISIAEQHGLILQLQNIVLRDICNLMNQLNTENIIDKLFRISINISQYQFNSSTLKDELFKKINNFNVQPSQIRLEITESMLSDDIDNTLQQMKELKESGFILSINGFGTGYSCLAHLSNFPIKELKINKSFIDNILNNDKGYGIVQAIISLAKSLNLSVVAEGVEATEQLNMLTTMGIGSIQGYLIAKPMSVSDYVTWHRSNVAKGL